MRRISDFPVFVCTAVFSLWAYIWMLIVYTWWTPDEITPVEAWLTLGYFFALIVISYIVDIKPWAKKAAPAGELEAASEPGCVAAGC